MPAGAGILTTAAERLDPRASMIPGRVGHGSRSRGCVVPDLLRGLRADALPGRSEELSVLQCNIDDMSPELIRTCLTIALERGLPLREVYRELKRLLEDETNGE